LNRAERRKQQSTQNKKKSNKVADSRIITTLASGLYIENVFSESECEKILSYRTEWKREDGKIERHSEGVSNLEYRRTTLYVPRRDDESVEWLIEKITNIVNAGNSEPEMGWKFNIRGMMEPFCIMEYTEGSLHESGIDGHYAFHIDIGPEVIQSMRKISYSVILNDDYDGGLLNLKMGRQDNYPPQKKGDIIIFPSYLLHCIEPVTRGTRYALVGWIHGPSFL